MFHFFYFKKFYKMFNLNLHLPLCKDNYTADNKDSVVIVHW